MSKAVEVLARVRQSPTRRRCSPRTACPTRCSPSPSAAAGRGLRAIIAGAGGAAHLPGMLAAKTTVPVLGVPVAVAPPRRAGLAVLDRADARRRPRGDVRDRRGGRDQRRAVRGGAAGASATTALTAALDAYRRRRHDEAAARRPAATVSADDHPAGNARHPRRWPARPLLRDGGAHDGLRHDRARARPARAGRRRSPTSTSSPPTTTSGAATIWRTACAVVTTEFENPPAAAMESLAAHTLVRPSPARGGDHPGPPAREGASSPTAGVPDRRRSP